MGTAAAIFLPLIFPPEDRSWLSVFRAIDEGPLPEGMD